MIENSISCVYLNEDQFKDICNHTNLSNGFEQFLYVMDEFAILSDFLFIIARIIYFSENLIGSSRSDVKIEYSKNFITSNCSKKKNIKIKSGTYTFGVY